MWINEVTQVNSVIFWEKPGCVGNNRQKSELRKQGIDLEVRDLISHQWSKDTLRPFFGGSPLDEWFNQTAPALKSGDIKPSELSEDDAIALMIDNPILIRRPLLQFEECFQSGFKHGPVLDAIGFQHEDPELLQICPMSSSDTTECEIE
jgi:nitrogenase-associated protein